jgi:hypothetical protein
VTYKRTINGTATNCNKRSSKRDRPKKRNLNALSLHEKFLNFNANKGISAFNK